MKRLYVLRHAKSSWADPDLADFDRPLNERGLQTAPFMGSVMQKNGYIPEVIFSSSATRARQTAELAVKGGQLKTEIRFDDQIYEASPQSLRLVTSEISEEFASAMVVGHNPGIEGFIRFLTNNLEPMPTAALAVIDLDVTSWDEISAGRGKVVRIIRPKDELRMPSTSN